MCLFSFCSEPRRLAFLKRYHFWNPYCSDYEIRRESVAVHVPLWTASSRMLWENAKNRLDARRALACVLANATVVVFPVKRFHRAMSQTGTTLKTDHQIR